MAKIIITLVLIYLAYKYVVPIILAPLKMLLTGCLILIVMMAVAFSAVYLMLT